MGEVPVLYISPGTLVTDAADVFLKEAGCEICVVCPPDCRNLLTAQTEHSCLVKNYDCALERTGT